MMDLAADFQGQASRIILGFHVDVLSTSARLNGRDVYVYKDRYMYIYIIYIHRHTRVYLDLLLIGR